MPSFSNFTPITIPDSGTATPYPSNILVSTPNILVSKITVTLHNVIHTFPGDLRILLVAPYGDNIFLMLNQGGSTNLTGIELTFDDDAATTIPTPMLNVSATYKPLTIVTSYPSFLAPAPVPQIYATSGGYTMTEKFTGSGKNPNGTWSLYVFDSASRDEGTIMMGWTITITGVPCLYPSTKVLTDKGPMQIRKIRSGQNVIDMEGRPVEVLYNMRFDPSVTRFVRIPKGSLGPAGCPNDRGVGPDLPESDLYITRGHPIFWNGQKIDPASLVNKKKQKNQRIQVVKVGHSANEVWSLCTKDRTFVMMEGIPVATWSHDEITEAKYRFTKF